MVLAQLARVETALCQDMGYSLDYDSKTSGILQYIGDRIQRALWL